MASSDNFKKTEQMQHISVVARMLLATVLLVGLSACGSKQASRVGDSGIGVSGPQSGSVAGVARRGGGYYLDDGPDDMPPEGLDKIPDAVPRIEPFHQPGFRPYTALNQQFVPRTALTPFRERGHASWYGRRFHGNPTSTGEPYDMYAMTAAHPTLPIPSYARVTNLANGRQVVVRINDRGPFLRGRVIDLSYAAAHRLGYINAGSAMVELESITHDDIRLAQARGLPALPNMASRAGSSASASVSAQVSEPRPAAVASRPLDANVATRQAAAEPPNVVTQAPLPPLSQVQTSVPVVASSVMLSPAVAEGAYLQLAAFSSSDNAAGLASRVRSELAMFADRLHLLKDGGRYRLQLGPFASVDDARIEARRIGALLDVQPFVVMR